MLRLYNRQNNKCNFLPILRPRSMRWSGTLVLLSICSCTSNTNSNPSDRNIYKPQRRRHFKPPRLSSARTIHDPPWIAFGTFDCHSGKMSCFALCVARTFHVLSIKRAVKMSCSKERYSRICNISSFGRVGSFVSVVVLVEEGGFRI